MMKNIFMTFLALFFILPCAVFGAEPCPEQVRVTFPDFAVPPLINGSGLSFSEPPGYLVEWVTIAIAKTGCSTKPIFDRRPMRRGLIEISREQTDILMPATPSTEQITQVIFPTSNGEIDKRLAFTSLEISLWVRKGERSIQWNGKELVGPVGFKVGVSAGSVGQSMALDRGWKIDAAVNSQNSIEKLIAGRVLVALVADVVMQSISEDKKLLIEKLNPGIGTTYFYSTPSFNFYAQHPEFMSKYWQALCRVSRAEKNLLEQRNLYPCP